MPVAKLPAASVVALLLAASALPPWDPRGGGGAAALAQEPPVAPGQAPAAAKPDAPEPPAAAAPGAETPAERDTPPASQDRPAGAEAPAPGGAELRKPATSPTTLPATSPTAVAEEARRLLDELAGDDWKQRQRAEDGLVELGDPARPLIEDLLGRSDDVEVRTRLESALKRIASDRLTGPSYVTLRLKDATAADAFSELSKQAFADLRPYPENLWQTGEWPRVTLDVRRKPFWAAALELSAAAGFGLQAWNEGLRVVQGPGQLSGPSVVHGPFLVVATQVNRVQTILLGKDGAAPARPPVVRNRSNEFGVHLLVLPEPKLSVVRAASAVKLEQAVDENGNDLAPPRAAGGHTYANGFAGAWNVYARLTYPPANPGKTIARLAGTATFVLQTASQRIELPEPLKLKDAFRVVAGSRVTFHEMARNGERYEVRVSLTPDGNAVAGGAGPGAEGRAVSALFQSVQTRLQVLDAAGRPLDRRGLSSEGNGREMRFTLHFAPRAGGAGEPAKLVWDVPTETTEVEVPFEFTDLPMP